MGCDPSPPGPAADARTFPPVLIELQDLVNEAHVGKPAPLALADGLRVAAAVCGGRGRWGWVYVSTWAGAAAQQGALITAAAVPSLRPR